MTYFLDLRTLSKGGGVQNPVVKQVSFAPGIPDPTVSVVPASVLAQEALGSDVIFVAHGFNVSREDGILCLSNWKKLLLLDESYLFVGILWPGDSMWLGALCYPGEGLHAMDSGNRLAIFIDKYLGQAASISFVSHSLGTRVVLQTIASMSTPVQQVALMAGAINDDCLVNEYQQAAQKISKISLLASTQDEVLAKAFPIGNLCEGLVDVGHPYRDAALGRSGPSAMPPGKLQGPLEIPDAWKYGHHHYLEVDPHPNPPFTLPDGVPPQPTSAPRPANGWQPAWSAAVVSTRFQET